MMGLYVYSMLAIVLLFAFKFEVLRAATVSNTITLRRILSCSAQAVLIFNTFHTNKALPDDDVSAINTNSVTIITSSNLLTNPVFEAMRKMDQVESDESLSTPSNTAILFTPILKISNTIEDCKHSLERIWTHSDDEVKAQSILRCINDQLAGSEFDAINFKKAFNRYADNIFYSDPSQANLYLGGGALPGSRQTQQYLLRNDILTYIQNAKEDMESTLSQKPLSMQDVEDLKDDLDKALESLQEYFNLANPEDVDLGKKIIASSTK
jgi:hypothetical protein